MKKEKSYKILNIVFLGVFLIAAFIRLYQLAANYDYTTGFFINHNNPTVYIFYALCVLITFGFIMTEKLHSDPETLTSAKPGALAGIGQLLLGVIMLIGGFKLFSNLTPYFGIISSEGFKVFSKQIGGIVFLLIPIFQVLSGLVFILHSVSSFTKQNFASKLSVLNLLPVFWGLFKVIECFTVTASYLKQSEIFVEVFTYVFAMIAFLGYARWLANIGVKESGVFFRPTSVLASGFSLLACFAYIFTGINTGKLSIIGIAPFAALFVFFLTIRLTVTASAISRTNVAEESVEKASEV